MMIATVLAFAGCKSNSGNQAALTANEWQLKEMTTSEGKVALSERVPTILLTDTNTMYGFAGCNRFFGKYTTEGNTIKLEPGGMTMMACPDLKFEDLFVKALAAMTSYSIENRELTFTDKDKKMTLVFKVKEADQKVGVANDAHGCNAAAGFTWSEVKKDCIRLFESGVRMNPANDPEATTSAFIVFSADSTQVEVFLPNVENHPILGRRSLPKADTRGTWKMTTPTTCARRKACGSSSNGQRPSTRKPRTA